MGSIYAVNLFDDIIVLRSLQCFDVICTVCCVQHPGDYIHYRKYT